VYKYGSSNGDCDVCEEIPAADTECRFGLIQTIIGDVATDNHFGYSVDLSGKKLAVSSPYKLTVSASYNNPQISFELNDDIVIEGTTVIYELDDDETLYRHVANISHTSLKDEPYKSFGYSVSIDDEFLFVGSPFNVTTSNFINPTTLEQQLTSITQGVVFSYVINEVGQAEHLGNVFYKNGLVVITNPSPAYQNILKDGYHISFQTQHTIYEEEYILTVAPGEFNTSQNPTSLLRESALFDINGNGTFDFEDVDLILRYINKYKIFVNTKIAVENSQTDHGFVLEQDLFSLSSSLSNAELIRRSIKAFDSEEAWWNNDIFMLESEDVLLNENITDLVEFFADDKLSDVYISKLIELDDSGAFDINGDGTVDSRDAAIILRYYNNYRDHNLIKSSITALSTRTSATQVVDLLDKYTGTNQDNIIHPNFYSYVESSSYDKTGSYLAPFVTTIGLYDDSYNLVGVAKLGTPIKIPKDYPLNFSVSWDR